MNTLWIYDGNRKIYIETKIKAQTQEELEEMITEELYETLENYGLHTIAVQKLTVKGKEKDDIKNFKWY